MFGAIFLQEMLVAGRRQRAYFLRWVYAGFLLIELGPRVLFSIWWELEQPGSSALGLYVHFFNHTFAAQHFILLLILTPALTAGAVTDEKLRGTLDYLLTTCLHPAEIVLGKLLARACQLLVLSLVALPLVCFFGVIVDLPLANVAALYVASAVVIVSTTALSMLASVWCHRTRDAVLAAYLVLLAGSCAVWASSAAGWDGPANLFLPWRAIDREDDEPLALRLVRFALAWLAPASACLALACWRLRPAYARIRQGTRVGWGRWRLRPMREDGNPVLWRERWLHGIAPLARLRAIPLWLAVTVCAFVSAASLLGMVVLQVSGRVDPIAAFQQEGLGGLHLALRLNGVDGWTVAGVHAGIALFVVTLLLIVRASGAITDERERSAWDALLLTPLTTREIVRGKFWGLELACLPYVLAYALPTLPLAFLVGAEAFVVCTSAVGAMLLAAPYIAAVGLYWSAHLSSSWRSLLATAAACYGYLILAMMLLGPAAFMVFCILSVFMMVLKPLFQEIMPDAEIFIAGLAGAGAMLAVNAAIVLPLSWALLTWAEGRVEKLERAGSRAEQNRQKLVLKLNQLADELAHEEQEAADPTRN